MNARNDDGDTPIATTVNGDGILLFLKHGADLTIRNKDGLTMREVTEKKGPTRAEDLAKAIAEMKEPS